MTFSYSERPHLGGVQRLYELPNGYRLSAVNSPVMHSYAFAWEIAVLGPEGSLSYDTPLTTDVEVFDTEAEAETFIQRAYRWAQQDLEAST